MSSQYELVWYTFGMNEKIPSSELSPERYIALAERLSEFPGILRFFGIEEMGYKKLKAESDEFPGYATHIDTLIKRFETEGIKIVIERGKVFVLPFFSNDIENDSIFPRFLKISDGMGNELKLLIRAGKQPS